MEPKGQETQLNDSVLTAKYISIQEASKFLGVSVPTIYRWVGTSPGQADPLPFVKFSRMCLRFPLRDLMAWAERRRGDITIQSVGKKS